MFQANPVRLHADPDEALMAACAARVEQHAQQPDDISFLIAIGAFIEGTSPRTPRGAASLLTYILTRYCDLGAGNDGGNLNRLHGALVQMSAQ